MKTKFYVLLVLFLLVFPRSAMSGRVEQIGIDQFVYTEVTVGLKKQGPGDDDPGMKANERMMKEGLELAMKRATLFKNSILKLKEIDNKVNSLEFKNIEKTYRLYESDQAGFANLPTWSEPRDIEKNINKPGYVLILDRDRSKGIGKTVLHFAKIPSLSVIELMRLELKTALENSSQDK